MRRILSLLLIFVMCVLVVGCDSKNSSSVAEETTETVAKTTAEITTESTTTEPITTEPPQLSDSCDMVLSSGYDGDDYYELITNVIDNYPSTTYFFGVIKNNEWFVEPTEKILFLDDEGRWKYLESYEDNLVTCDDFNYLGDGVFLYKGSAIYRPSTGAFFENLCNRDYSELENLDKFVGFQSYHEEGTANNSIFFKCFNTKTGDAKEIKGYFEKDGVNRPKELYDISDGLFFASYYSQFSNEGYGGFFDLKGNQIINTFDDYDVLDYGDYMFHDGEYTMTVKNDAGIEFELTFNTKGKIVNQVKME